MAKRKASDEGFSDGSGSASDVPSASENPTVSDPISKATSNKNKARQVRTNLTYVLFILYLTSLLYMEKGDPPKAKKTKTEAKRASGSVRPSYNYEPWPYANLGIPGNCSSWFW
jgi:hypothetical protein